MSGEMAVSFAIKLNDQGSAAATQALNKLSRALKETEGVAKSTSTAAINAFQKLASSREILGIRSEKAIQNEIRQTEAAYKRLADSGQASARELGRAQDAMRQKVADLRREMEGAKQSAGGMPRALQAAMGAFGAYQAGKMVLQGPVKSTMSYSMELAHASNTLYANQSVAERIAAKSRIDRAVMEGARAGRGGVSREDSLEGLKALANSGVFGGDPEVAYKVLPSVTKAAAANNASVVSMANIAIKAREVMKLNDADRVLNIGARGGVEGQFELRSMDKWLPQQMAYAQGTGLTGYQGFATLVAANQVAMTTAGSADEAGNNVKNLLAKINSSDTANDAKKLGIDLSGTLAAARAKGVNGVDAFLNLTDQISAKDPRLAKLKEQAKTATGGDLKENLEAQKRILERSSIGKIIQDQQAMSALVALLNGRGRFAEIRDKSLKSDGTNDSMLDVVSSEAEAKVSMARIEKENALQHALDKVNPLFGQLADHLVSNAREYPALTAATTGATVALTALAAAAGAAALPGILMPGGGGSGGAGGMASRALGFIGKGLAIGGSFAAGYAGGSWLNGKINDGVSWATDGRENSLGGLVHSMTHPDEMQGYSAKRPTGTFESGSAGAISDQKIVIENKIILDGRQMAESVNEHNARLGSRN